MAIESGLMKASTERPRQTRSSREYTLRLLGKEYKVESLGEALKTTLLKLEKPGFFEEVYKRRIEMRRCQLVGRKREDMFPNGKTTSENNQKYHVHRLNSEWYYRSLMSVPACNSHLEFIASVAGIETPRLVERAYVNLS
jgi:hypothetical protein